MKALFKIYWQYTAIIITLGLMTAFCPAYGQQQDEKTDDTDTQTYSLETITVTAGKRPENIQKVPAAITAFTETELEDTDTINIPDLFEMIPGLNIQTQAKGWYNATYRGLGRSSFTGKNPIVIYVDGVPMDSRTDYDSDLLNIERVEFLHGPQGTLYGKNAIGGVINIISKKPDNTTQGKVSGTCGQDGNMGFRGTVSGPLMKDTLFMSLSGQYDEARGYMANDAQGEDHYDDELDKSLKAQIGWVASERLEVNFRSGVSQSRNGVGPSISSDQVTYHADKSPNSKSDYDGYDAALHINYSAGFADFNATTTYRNAKTDFLEMAVDENSGRVADLESNTYTQELRMQSPDNGSDVKWVAGLYYAYENSWSNEFGNIYNMQSSYGYNMKTNYLYDQDEKTMAVFGQATVPLWGPVNFTAGLRYENTEKSMDYNGATTRQDTNAVLSSARWNDEDDWDALLPKGVVSWTVTPDALLYFSVAQGYLAGGFNNCTNDKDTAKFDEETSTNYEIGAKTEWLDNRLILNATLFYVDIRDMHVYSQPEPGVWVASNAAQAHSQGIELEAKARPVKGLDLTGSVAITNAEFDKYSGYQGNTPTYTPEYSFFIGAQYRFVNGLYVRGEMNGYGKTYYDAANTISQSHLELFNAKIGYETGRWDTYIYVNNLTDEHYFTDMSSASNYVGAPRTVGMMMTVRF